ncbi:RcpC/CpaB family pilus assembly protein [Streptomyces sp. NBC_00566]|uniref:RcpC/CpaB family pilus assembly protein n=1 Tax=Streptomyces sp. NBC_00566 TaxID=2975778 RepID=UPI002E8249ED|nr:RcpC/CpaB family pilus assembly protein [Streptomyces sp. NBC_00566]WUB88297.1 RcpC/CpaB family pilus assembly protein [Streptomyces sp. NBC_00566]
MSVNPNAVPAFRVPRPLGTDAPATREVPFFPPVRVRGSGRQAGRLARCRGRAVAAGLAVTAAALVAAGPRPLSGGTQSTERPRGHPTADPVRRHGPGELVRAPVRIADAAAVRLLRPGDRVDVIAAEERSADGGAARVLARGARVARLPELPELPAQGEEPGAGVGEGSVTAGALVVLAVPRATAARLVGASPTARLAVALW